MIHLLRLKKENRLFFVLVLFTIFDLMLIVARIYFGDFDVHQLDSISEIKSSRGVSGTFFFLVWNLFLAWVPYLVARLFDPVFSRTGSVGIVAFLMFMWLLFFPNAPYIVTDLLHLRDRQVVPHWYDVVLFISFAWTGLLLGFGSLHLVQRFVRRHISAVLSWAVAFGAIILGSFGVYLGRFQRWNSWDLFTQPMALLRDVGYPMLYPASFTGTWGVTIVLAAFLSIGYLTFILWGEDYSDPR